MRCGYLKKLKTSRKKFFVLRAETAEASARLEYYDSERKFHGGQPPKRSIPLKNCFNINRRLDTKHKHVIALYTKDDCFCVVLESEEDVDGWLKALLKLQHGEEVVDGEAPKPTFGELGQAALGFAFFFAWGVRSRVSMRADVFGPEMPALPTEGK